MILVSCNSETELEFEINIDSIEYFTFVNFPKVNQYSVYVSLNGEYTKKFEQITAENIGKELSIIMGTTTLVKTIIQCKIPSGNFSISNFDSPKDSKEFMQRLLKNQYLSKLYQEKIENFEFELSHYDSLLIQSSKDYINFDFQSAYSKLSELVKITKHNSDDYKGILINYLLMNLRANNYQKAEKYFDELNTFIDSNNSGGLEFYKKGGVLNILILLGNNKMEEAKELKVKYEMKTDFSNKMQVIIESPFYSFICYKFGDYDKAINKLSEYINAFSKNGQLQDNNYYLLQLMYYYSSNSYDKALELSESILSIDADIYRYDAVQSKLWHSIILLKNDRKEEALNYYISAKKEFNAIDHPEKLTLRILLTPYLGVFPSDDLYKDFDEIAGLSGD
jgi:tetratricopeptide (TPR) repeat protein